MSKLSPQKAREMINNPPHGKKLTKKQNAYFHLVAEGRNKYEEGGWLDKYMPQVDPEMMYNERYNTPLSPLEKKEFDKWVAGESKRQGRNILMDMGNYDVQGFWKNDRKIVGGHASDKWKKPNHPTFSNESIYHGADNQYGGNWGEDGSYYPTRQTRDLYDEEYYKRLFGREPERPEHLNLSKSTSYTPSIYANGGEVNYNTPSVSLPKDYVGIGYDTTGRNYSPAWGGAFANGGNIPGTVGFTYARTGSTPSNGKYAKKTMASAEDGKTITDRSKDFLLNWYGERDIPGVDNQAVVNSIMNLPRERQVYMIDNNPNIQAQYTGREFLYKPNASDYVKTHERTHYIDEKFPSIMDINAKAIQGNIKPLDQLQGISNRKYDYLSSPEEMHSRIMTLRQKAGFKPNQTVTEDDLNNFLNRYKGDEQNIEDIFDVAKDKGSVVNMLNLMALNKNENNMLPIAKDGVELTKLDQLTNWTNYNKPTRGGWLSKYE